MLPSKSRSPSCSHKPSASYHRSKPFTHLSPRTTHISATRILKTWRPLPLPTQDRIRSLLLALKNESLTSRRNHSVQGARNGMGMGMSKKALNRSLDVSDAEWEAVVTEVVERLVRRVGKMPFPSSGSKSYTTSCSSSSTLVNPTRNKGVAAAGEEQEFDFEATLSRTGQLEAELSSHVDAIRVLREQIQLEQELLRRDREEYKRLEEGLRSERALSKDQARRLHPLARRERHEAESEDGEGLDLDDRENRAGGDEGDCGAGEENGWMQCATRKRAKRVDLTDSEMARDPDLAALVQQLRSHLDSMTSNTAVLSGVSEGMDEAEVAISLLESRLPQHVA